MNIQLYTKEKKYILITCVLEINYNNNTLLISKYERTTLKTFQFNISEIESLSIREK